MDVEEMFESLEQNKFRLHLIVPFVNPLYKIPESLYIWHQPKLNILLRVDTFGGSDENVNSAKMYYNIKRKPGNTTMFKYVSSGHCFSGDQENFIWIGSHSVTDGGITNIVRVLKRCGKFLNPWVEQPFLWLLHHGDTKIPDYDYGKINAERIAMLPEDVQKAIGASH